MVEQSSWPSCQKIPRMETCDGATPRGGHLSVMSECAHSLIAPWGRRASAGAAAVGKTPSVFSSVTGPTESVATPCGVGNCQRPPTPAPTTSDIRSHAPMSVSLSERVSAPSTLSCSSVAWRSRGCTGKPKLVTGSSRWTTVALRRSRRPFASHVLSMPPSLTTTKESDFSASAPSASRRPWAPQKMRQMFASSVRPAVSSAVWCSSSSCALSKSRPCTLNARSLMSSARAHLSSACAACRLSVSTRCIPTLLLPAGASALGICLLAAPQAILRCSCPPLPTPSADGGLGP